MYVCVHIYVFMNILYTHTPISTYTYTVFLVYDFWKRFFSAKIPTRPTSAAGATTCQKDSRVHTRTYTST